MGNIFKAGDFYLSEYKNTYYMFTVNYEYDGVEEGEYVSGYEITKDIYESFKNNNPIPIKTPIEMEIEVLKIHHSDSCFPSKRTWVFDISCDNIYNQINNNLNHYEVYYNMDIRDIEMYSINHKSVRIVISENLDKDLIESYNSVCRKAKYLKHIYDTLGIYALSAYIDGLSYSGSKIEEDIENWEE